MLCNILSATHAFPVGHGLSSETRVLQTLDFQPVSSSALAYRVVDTPGLADTHGLDGVAHMWRDVHMLLPKAAAVVLCQPALRQTPEQLDALGDVETQLQAAGAMDKLLLLFTHCTAGSVASVTSSIARDFPDTPLARLVRAAGARVFCADLVEKRSAMKARGALLAHCGRLRASRERVATTAAGRVPRRTEVAPAPAAAPQAPPARL